MADDRLYNPVNYGHQYHYQTGFQRYWDYYNRVMEWKRHHQHNSAFQSLNSSLRPNGQFINDLSNTGSAYQRQQPELSSTDPRSCNGNDDDADYHNHNRAQLDESDEEFIFEMEVTEEMLAFLEKSDAHRRQLKAERDAAAKLRDVNTSEDERPSGPPSEQPGVQRTSEMKQLYGKRAATIHGMETAVQLTFHRNCDYFQPKHWPNIPIKLQFK